MNEINVRVTGVSILDHRPNDIGTSLIASFDCRIGPIAFVGCVLLRTIRGLSVQLPRLAERGTRHAAQIADQTVRARLLEAALTAYRAIGGTQA